MTAVGLLGPGVGPACSALITAKTAALSFACAVGIGISPTLTLDRTLLGFRDLARAADGTAEGQYSRPATVTTCHRQSGDSPGASAMRAVNVVPFVSQRIR